MLTYNHRALSIPRGKRSGIINRAFDRDLVFVRYVAVAVRSSLSMMVVWEVAMARWGC